MTADIQNLPFEERLAGLRAKVLAGEFQVITANAGYGLPAYAYSVGLSLLGEGYPELISIGKISLMAHYMYVNTVGQLWAKQGLGSMPGGIGVYRHLLGSRHGVDMPLEIAELSPKVQVYLLDMLMPSVRKLLPERTMVQVAQVQYADVNGHLPRDAAYDYDQSPQFLLTDLLDPQSRQ